MQDIEPLGIYENTEHFENAGIDHVLQAAQVTLLRHIQQNVEELFESYVAAGDCFVTFILFDEPQFFKDSWKEKS